MIAIIKNNNSIIIKIEFDIYNDSDTIFDLELLNQSIVKQLATVYNTTVGNYKIAIICASNIIRNTRKLSPHKILFQIVDSLNGNNPAEADFCGLRIKLNKSIISDIISKKNTRTIPHELGHLLGWNHPHANALYESVNPNGHELEKQLTELERCCNLMSQTWYAQKAEIELQNAMKLTTQQIEILLFNYKNKLLNKNYHLNYFWFWKKLV